MILSYNIRDLMHRIPHKNVSMLFCVLSFSYETHYVNKFDLYIKKELKIATYEA
jgi:hypothetical protein